MYFFIFNFYMSKIANFKIKRFVIFELKTHRLTHQDIGQLDIVLHGESQDKGGGGMSEQEKNNQILHDNYLILQMQIKPKKQADLI